MVVAVKTTSEKGLDLYKGEWWYHEGMDEEYCREVVERKLKRQRLCKEWWTKMGREDGHQLDDIPSSRPTTLEFMCFINKTQNDKQQDDKQQQEEEAEVSQAETTEVKATQTKNDSEEETEVEATQTKKDSEEERDDAPAGGDYGCLESKGEDSKKDSVDAVGVVDV